MSGTPTREVAPVRPTDSRRGRPTWVAAVLGVALACLPGAPTADALASPAGAPRPGSAGGSPPPSGAADAEDAADADDSAGPDDPARFVTWLRLPGPQRVAEGAAWRVEVYLRLGTWVGGYGYLELLQPDGTWRQHPEEKWIQGTVGQSWHTLTWDLTAAPEHAGQLRFRSWTGAGSGTVGHSDPVPVTVEMRRPTLLLQPTSRAVVPGTTVVLQVRAATAGTGERTTVQWETSREGGPWTAVPGATGVDHVVTASAETAGRYRAVVTRSRDLPPGTVPAVASAAVPGVTRSTEVALSLVGVRPTVATHPDDSRVVAGQPATFEAAATGTEPLRAQWQRSADGGQTWTDLAGETGTSLTVPAPGPTDDGLQLRAAFRNDLGSAVTDPATLRVVAVPPLRLEVDARVQRVGALPGG